MWNFKEPVEIGERRKGIFVNNDKHFNVKKKTTARPFVFFFLSTEKRKTETGDAILKGGHILQ